MKEQDGSLKITEDAGCILSNTRRTACLEATWEIEAIADHMAALLEDATDGKPSAGLVMRSLIARVAGLNRAIISGLCDELASAEKLKQTVTLKEA